MRIFAGNAWRGVSIVVLVIAFADWLAFYRVWLFYQKRWPNNTPEIYAYMALSTVNAIQACAAVWTVNAWMFGSTLSVSWTTIILVVTVMVMFLNYRRFLLGSGSSRGWIPDSRRVERLYAAVPKFRGEWGGWFVMLYLGTWMLGFLIFAARMRVASGF